MFGHNVEFDNSYEIEKSILLTSETPAKYGVKVLGSSPLTVRSMNTLNDRMYSYLDDDRKKVEKRPHYNLNVGRALEGLRRELPLIFIAHDLDFSIFANSITVIDEGQRKIELSKYIYQTAVKTLRMASSFSSIYPSMNVRKIEYIEDIQSIQCIVQVVLPDSIRVDGQSVWEGMFYFGLNEDGFISSHVFDRKISKKTPMTAEVFPWLASKPQWDAELVSACPLI